MNSEFNGSSYYRANPYYQQGYLPDTAFKNRKIPSYMVQLPQGENAFDLTNKKHFQRVGYYSTIGEQHIMNPDPLPSPSRDQAYFRSLNINDIEGAGTNTLISKAVKNRLKAKQYLVQREREQKEEEARQKMKKYQSKEEEKMRLEALSKINRANEPNYHEKVMKMKTEESQGQLSPQIHRQDIPDGQQKSHQNQYDYYKTQLERTERQIKELEAQLRQSRTNNPPNPSISYENYPKSQLNQQRLEPNFYRFHEQSKELIPSSLKQPNQPKYANSLTQRGQNNYLPAENTYHHFTSYQQAPQNLSQDHDIRQKKQLQKLRNYSGAIEPATKMRSLTSNVPPTGIIAKINEVRQLQPPRALETPIYDNRNQARQTREQHRRINPTYLSYGSASIGLAGRRVVGQ